MGVTNEEGKVDGSVMFYILGQDHLPRYETWLSLPHSPKPPLPPKKNLPEGPTTCRMFSVKKSFYQLDDDCVIEHNIFPAL